MLPCIFRGRCNTCFHIYNTKKPLRLRSALNSWKCSTLFVKLRVECSPPRLCPHSPLLSPPVSFFLGTSQTDSGLSSHSKPMLCWVCHCVPKPEVERESEDFVLSLFLSLSAHYTYTLHAEFALTRRNKIIKDSCKTKKEISIAQGHYKGSVC